MHFHSLIPFRSRVVGLFAIAFFAGSLVPASAQTERLLSPPFFPTIGYVTYSMVTVDLNGDGIPDVATSDQDGTTVDILLGTGDGAFQAARSFAAGNGPSAIAVGDMNGDGKPDLVLPDSNAKKNAVAILLGNGDGTFQAKKQFEGGAFPDSAALGDFNGDGRLDVVVTNASITAGTINVMLGNGDGTLQLPTPFTTAKNPRSVVVGDFDGNGRLDLAVATLVGNAVSVLLGNGNGTFQARQDYPTGTSSYAVIQGDFNGDGGMDLAVSNTSSRTISLLVGNGNGTFQPAINTPTAYDPRNLAARDLNQDGRLDLVVSEGLLTVYLGLGNGTFQTPSHYSPGGSAAVIGDFDGRAGLDLVVGAAGPDFAPGIALLSGLGDGTFLAPRSFPTPLNVLASGSRDLNGDGKPDLVVTSTLASSGTNQASVFLNSGDGTFAGHADYGTGQLPGALSFSDVNGDNVDDIAVANRTDNSISILPGNGNGTFLARQDFATGTSPQSIAAGDLNGDGRADLVTANNLADGTLSILLNAGNGSFPAHTELSAGPYPGTVAVQDLNGDGKLDLAVSYAQTNGLGAMLVSVFLGQGDGTFQSRVDYPLGGTPTSAVVGISDVNGDGKPDLVAVRSDQVTSVFLGNGHGSFQPAVANPGIAQAATVGFGDLNGDGKQDLVVAGYAFAGASGVGLFLGNGDGTFQAPSRPLLYPIASATVADFNDDGALDVSTASGGAVIILPNTGGSQVALTSSKNPSRVGQRVTFTAQIEPTFDLTAPSGLVQFLDGDQVIGSGSVTNGQAAFSTDALSSGRHSIRANYLGDDTFVPRLSSITLQRVRR